jgi:hypothetical protein
MKKDRAARVKEGKLKPSKLHNFNTEEGGEIENKQDSYIMGRNTGMEVIRMDEITGISNAQLAYGPTASMWGGGVAGLGEGVDAELEIQTEWGKTGGTLYATVLRHIEIVDGMEVRQWGRALYFPKDGQVLEGRIPRASVILR